MAEVMACHQTITETSDDPIRWRIFVSPCLDVFVDNTLHTIENCTERIQV